MSELRQYRNKPRVVEAIKWDGTMDSAYQIKQILGPNIMVMELEKHPPIPVRAGKKPES